MVEKNLNYKDVLKIIIIGPLFSIAFVIIFSIYLAQITVDFVAEASEGVLYFIVFGYLFLALFSSILVGFFLIRDTSRLSVVKATIISYLATLFFLWIISNLSMNYYYPDVYSKLQGIEILIAFPQTLFNFGIHTLDNIFMLYILSFIIYFLVFTFSINEFYEYTLRR